MVHLAESGHGNGTPERNESVRYRSFILLANKEILDGKEVRCNVVTFQSGLTKRVCRSTLAAEASHLAETVVAGDWVAVLLEEALTGQLDLPGRSMIICSKMLLQPLQIRGWLLRELFCGRLSVNPLLQLLGGLMACRTSPMS